MTNTHLGQDVSIRERASRLLKACPLIGQEFYPYNERTLTNSNSDGHNDFPYMLRGWFRNNLNDPNFDIHDLPIGQTDLQRLRKGRLGGQFWSAYVPMQVSPDHLSA